jgi:hypothetical protein
VHIGLAFTKKIQGNWCVWAYPAAMIPIGWLAQEDRYRKWHKIGAYMSVAVLSIGFILPTLQLSGNLAWLPYKANPWRHVLGWSQLPEALEKAGWQQGEDFLFADRYQTASLVSLYNTPKQRSYFFNLSGARRNQFSYWPQMVDEQIGATGYFVWVENTDRINGGENHIVETYQEDLDPYFDQVTSVGSYPLWQVGGRIDKIAILFRCEGYNGTKPEESDRF